MAIVVGGDDPCVLSDDVAHRNGTGCSHADALGTTDFCGLFCAVCGVDSAGTRT